MDLAPGFVLIHFGVPYAWVDQVRVLIADDQRLFAEALEAILDRRRITSSAGRDGGTRSLALEHRRTSS